MLIYVSVTLAMTGVLYRSRGVVVSCMHVYISLVRNTEVTPTFYHRVLELIGSGKGFLMYICT